MQKDYKVEAEFISFPDSMIKICLNYVQADPNVLLLPAKSIQHIK